MPNLSKLRNRILLLLVGVFLPFYGFGELAEEVWEQQGGFPWDDPILLWIHRSASLQLDWWVSALTQTGGFWGVTTLASGVALVLWRRRNGRALFYFVLTMLGNGLINRVAKLLLRRVRPQLWTSPAPEFDYGFPSGHAMASMALVTTLVILSWHRPWRGWALGLGAIYVCLIAWTRLYLGVHYPSDVLAGWMVSIAWAVGMSLVIRPLNSSQPSRGSR